MFARNNSIYLNPQEIEALNKSAENGFEPSFDEMREGWKPKDYLMYLHIKCIELQNTCIESENTCIELQNTCIESENKCIELQNTCIESENKCIELQNTCIESENKYNTLCIESAKMMCTDKMFIISLDDEQLACIATIAENRFQKHIEKGISEPKETHPELLKKYFFLKGSIQNWGGHFYTGID
jgi:hypothetical protein